MAAYAALLSLEHIIKQLQHHPHPPISLDNGQTQSLIENLTFLQEFLENYSSNFCGSEDAEALERRIVDAAHAAEDIIESHIVDQIQANGKDISSIDLYDGLQKVIQKMESIKKDVIEIKEKMGSIQLDRNDSILAAGGSSFIPSPSSTRQSTTVGLDDVLIEEVMHKLTGQQSNLQIIPIVGMGGIGKTTLARTLYTKPLIVEYFDFRGWTTISQEYNSKQILLEVLVSLNIIGSRESLSQMSEHEVGDKLYKSLFGRRYFIVMDDIWSIEAWDKVKMFFPDNHDGSRIVMTTRISNLAFQVSGSRDLEMSFLDEDKSWNLLCKTVFGEEDCPCEFRDIGKTIAKNCKGLPLSIVVIGGLLAKSQQTRENWQYVAENLNSIVNLEDSERCLKTLRMSYNHLPVHLKPCFLYMGVFREDEKIKISWLIKLWVAEGFLKPISGKSLEMVAKEYLRELVDRNLVLVDEMGFMGNIKYCKIHDFLRDLCLKEAEKDKFICLPSPHDLNIPQDIHNQRRIVVHPSTIPQVNGALLSASLARSWLCYSRDGDGHLPFLSCRLLRVLRLSLGMAYYNPENNSLETICQLVNLRCLYVYYSHLNPIPSSIYHLWNLQTLIADRLTPFEIWKMPQLRHVVIRKLKLPDPPLEDDFVVLGNLQTLSLARNFKLSEEVVKRIPNIKTLKIKYEDIDIVELSCLSNVCRLGQLEVFNCSFRVKPSRSELDESLIFPHSLKKLTLGGTNLHWEEMGTMIGSLPCLEMLKLYFKSFVGPEWETVEGQFQSLKYLKISFNHDLEHWRTESTHFPRLEHLKLRGLRFLKKIPFEIGEIPTLKSIELDWCSDSAIISAKEMQNEQEGLGNVGLQVIVQLGNENEVVDERLASHNFIIIS